MTRKKYKRIPTKKQLKIMKKYWKALQIIETHFRGEIYKLEQLMSQECGIKDMIFFASDFGEYCGIGSDDRTLTLTHDRDLE